MIESKTKTRDCMNTYFQCDFKQLADKYGTPLYIYDLDSISRQFYKIKDSLKGFKSLICYALKANSNLSIIKHIGNLGSGADCVSINEIKRALLGGIPPYKIIFSGVGKSDLEIQEAIGLDVLFINVESEMELFRIEKIARDIYNKPSRISIRVNPDVDAKTHPYISTGLHENKFGLDIESAKKLYIYAKKSPFLNPVGIHYHIGSQILDSRPLLESSQKILELAKSIKALDIDLRFFDIGGGFGIQYSDCDNEFDIGSYIGEIVRKVDSLDLTLICEPGRFIMGNSGVLLTSVIGEKITQKKRFVIVDCAMNDLLRPSLYDAHHDISLVHGVMSEKSSICDVVGPICESGDYLAKDITLPHCNSGDLLLIQSSGAYGYSMSSNYNSRMRAAEIALYNGVDYVIKDREDFDLSVKNELSHLDSMPYPPK